MIFNSIAFCVFFIIVFLIYYFPLKNNKKAQNYLLLIASYFFYGFANWKLIPILLIATIIIYVLGIEIHKTTDPKRSSFLSTLGVLIGVGLLSYFKYFNFFIESFSSLFIAFGLKPFLGALNIVMPLGISFFTFKLISYIIEIKRCKLKPTNDFVLFATYISFFPTILSGPIDKPNFFIPQLQKKRNFNYDLVTDGFRQIIWGCFQKMVIADNLAEIINDIWRNVGNQNGSTLFITAILFSFQLYTDFSGYSHIAIGIGKILGFQITKNFNNPFFSKNIAQFWRTWHISLTSWLTDYVFMPLNIKFRNYDKLGIILAIIINMAAVGMWHGANWTFLIFGLYQGLLYIPLIINGSFLKKDKLNINKYGLPVISDFFKIIITFLLFSLGLIFFKAENISMAITYFTTIFSKSIFSTPHFTNSGSVYYKFLLVIIILVTFVIIEWKNRDADYAISELNRVKSRLVRWFVYILIIFITTIMYGTSQDFIYIQF